MELSFKELKKRDVINVSDGRCLGSIIDLSINFPDGELAGIIVPGRKKKGIFWIFDKTEVYIDVTRIVKIGNDVILVDLRCEDGGKRPNRKPRPAPPPPHGGCANLASCEDFLNNNPPSVKIDTSDY